jgi:hypothetical protein
MSAQILAFPRKRRPVCPLDEAFARLRRTELAMEAAAAEIEAVARRLENANKQKELNNGR